MSKVIIIYNPGRDVPATGAAAERQRVRVWSVQNLHQVLGQRRGESCILYICICIINLLGNTKIFK